MKSRTAQTTGSLPSWKYYPFKYHLSCSMHEEITLIRVARELAHVVTEFPYCAARSLLIMLVSGVRQGYCSMDGAGCLPLNAHPIPIMESGTTLMWRGKRPYRVQVGRTATACDSYSVPAHRKIFHVKWLRNVSDKLQG